jgi:hypothetical protein
MQLLVVVGVASSILCNNIMSVFLFFLGIFWAAIVVIMGLQICFFCAKFWHLTFFLKNPNNG